MVFPSLWATWKGALKFTAAHALFIARAPPGERTTALVDYWLGRAACLASCRAHH